MAAFVCSGMLAKAKNILDKKNSQCRCLVLGASGALGSVMVQLLKRKGCHVIGICSGKNSDMVKSMGADEVVDYTKGEIGSQLSNINGLDKISAVFDFVGGKQLEKSLSSTIAPSGIYITAVGEIQNANEQKFSGCQLFGIIRRVIGRSMCNTCCCYSRYSWTILGDEPPLTADMWNAVVLEAGCRSTITEELVLSDDSDSVEKFRAALRKVWSKHAGGRVMLKFA